MDTNIKQDNAVAAIRISSIKQGLQGDSPEAQREQIERFAQAHNINVKKYFVFIESASREQQPIQEAIDYCKNPKNDVQLFIIKSIDRFTRGGSYLYDHLKMQLTKYGVKLVDIYGVIGTQEVNTLEHLDISYNWSVYSPTKKAELLEAERAKDEMRDIMTRMIGAEIRYVRMGYRVRPAPFGYINDKVETQHGKRVILIPHPEESQWIKKMFELRIRGTLTDQQIVDEINEMGFKSRIKMRRNPSNRKLLIGQIGGKQLNLKQLWRLIQNPIYAGFNIESWTNQQLIKGRYEGLISIETFNKANKGKLAVIEHDGEFKLQKNISARYLIKRGVRNVDFPYKRYVLCPHCEKPLFGSASRGKMGKYYPAYHCNKRGHYFRVSKKNFDNEIFQFVKSLQISQEYIDELMKAVLEEWNKRQITITNDKDIIDNKIAQLQTNARSIADKIGILSSETAIKYMEADLEKIDNQIKQLSKQTYQTDKKWIDIEAVKSTVKYFLEHLEDLLLEGLDPINRASYFGLVFEKAPTYEELVSGTPELAPFIALKDDFEVSNSLMVNDHHFELIEFDTLDKSKNSIYHTNVMLSLGHDWAVVCSEAIVPTDRKNILERLEVDREVIEITINQMESFCANIIELVGKDGLIVVMSTSAYNAFLPSQIEILEKYSKVIHTPYATIEKIGGGGVKCSIAENFLQIDTQTLVGDDEIDPR